ncbi:hypothetical protein DAMA08_004120 [Martiniozyma asiatica (nom. inval.)]|nr:hypothetical protein DAMA08_004120 [Martiniozyma asiatica]
MSRFFDNETLTDTDPNVKLLQDSVLAFQNALGSIDAITSHLGHNPDTSNEYVNYAFRLMHTINSNLFLRDALACSPFSGISRSVNYNSSHVIHSSSTTPESPVHERKPAPTQPIPNIIASQVIQPDNSNNNNHNNSNPNIVSSNFVANWKTDPTDSLKTKEDVPLETLISSIPVVERGSYLKFYSLYSQSARQDLNQMVSPTPEYKTLSGPTGLIFNSEVVVDGKIMGKGTDHKKKSLISASVEAAGNPYILQYVEPENKKFWIDKYFPDFYSELYAKWGINEKGEPPVILTAGINEYEVSKTVSTYILPEQLKEFYQVVLNKPYAVPPYEELQNSKNELYAFLGGIHKQPEYAHNNLASGGFESLIVLDGTVVSIGRAKSKKEADHWAAWGYLVGYKKVVGEAVHKYYGQ